jgi:hypothetical protein
MADDTLSCWSDPQAAFPLGNVPSGRFASVHVGAWATCARDLEGKVVCFGNARILPSTPRGPTLRICHDYAPCVERADGTAECFNDEPDQSLGLIRPGSLACGSSWSCAIALEGTVRCVLASKVMAFGSDAMPAASWELPKGVYRAVFSGYQHGCARKDDGSILCWGRDTALETHPPKGSFQTLALGEKISCGLRPNGDIECWGRDPGGPWRGPFRALGVTTHMAGDNSVCAIREDETIACWDYGD